MKLVIWDQEFELEDNLKKSALEEALGNLIPQAKDAYHLALRSGLMTNTKGLEGESPTLRDVDAILAFLPFLENPGESAVSWGGGEEVFKGIRMMPHAKYSDDLRAFTMSLYARNIVYSFDWQSWEAGATVSQSLPSLIDHAGFNTIRCLLTAHVRNDRFCEGHLGSVLKDGMLARIVRRLAHLRKEHLLPVGQESSDPVGEK